VTDLGLFPLVKFNFQFYSVYNESGSSFDKIPFEMVLPGLLLKYGTGQEVLEIGSGAGALAFWLAGLGYQVSCIEPAEELAKRAEGKGLRVYVHTIQDFETTHQYDSVVAISSLIHVPKSDLPAQVQKIYSFLKPQGTLFVSFIEGENEGFEDPTNIGKLRFFAKWKDKEVDSLFLSQFTLCENQKIYNKKMDCNFLLKVYVRKDLD
jgi:2-polyprenyl-3-methyl-5-hydroxy-6-metoxy-1,4-benzoquinol methylase